ncbi:MAG: ABC transporter permease [Spirochaetia bacterium]
MRLDWKKEDRLSDILMGAAILLGTIGIVLFVASYFSGLIFISASGGVYILRTLLTKGRDDVTNELRSLWKNISIPIYGITLAVLLGAVIMLITGYNPLPAYRALFFGGFVKNWHISVLNATPLIFTGLSVAFAFKAGLFNIGAEGQFYIGSMAAAFFGIYLRLPPIITIPLILLLSGTTAALYNYIPAILKVKTGAHEVITTMMFAHIARYLSPVFIRRMGGDPATSNHPYVTDPIKESSELPIFKSFLPDANYRLHTGILIAIGMALLVYFILYYTKYGYEVRSIGFNTAAAKSKGINVGRNIFFGLLFAGFLAGLSGANQVLGLDHKMFENLSAGYGWNGISVALLASNHPIGVILTALLWGALDAGGQYMARTVQTPNAIVEIIKGIILFLIVARYIYGYVSRKLFNKTKPAELSKEII